MFNNASRRCRVPNEVVGTGQGFVFPRPKMSDEHLARSHSPQAHVRATHSTTRMMMDKDMMMKKMMGMMKEHGMMMDEGKMMGMMNKMEMMMDEMKMGEMGMEDKKMMGMMMKMMGEMMMGEDMM